MSRQISSCLLLLLAGALSACSGADMGGTGSSGYGATPGGVKDLKAARKAAEDGLVPDPDALVVEAIFAEHDLPLDGPPCADTLCLRNALGYAPDHDGAARGWLQVGLSSNIQPSTYQRPPVSLVACVDVSGSMAWGGNPDSPGEMSRRLLQHLIPQLGAQDELAIVAYGTNVRDVIGFTPGDRHGELLAAVDSLSENGSTYMEEGVRRAFELARSGSRAERRVLLFTDAQPNVGATAPTDFERMTEAAAAEGTHMTVLAMGVGMSPAHMVAMAHLRGANAFSFMEGGDVPDFMQKQWPFFLSPIAHDLTLKVSARPGFKAARGYGFPAGPDAQDALALEVRSVFLSRNRGALLVQLDPDTEATLAQLGVVGTLSYTPVGGTRVTRSVDNLFSGPAMDDRGQAFEQRGVARTTALALLVSGMRDAVELYVTGNAASQADAAERMDRVASRFEADAAALGDEDLVAEAAFGRLVADLVVARAPVR